MAPSVLPEAENDILDPTLLWQVVLLGLVEGLTEFLPISSTGHLILTGAAIGFHGPPGKVFEVAVQMGAILAVIVAYFARFRDASLGILHDPAARRFWLLLLLGLVPAMVLGATFHGFIKATLFQPEVVCASLILGGAVLILLDRLDLRPRYASVDAIPLRTAFLIGCAQAVAMIPGTSRSGATIVGGMLLGLDRRTSVEFSFFLAVPTMAAATAYDLYKGWSALDAQAGLAIAVGFVVAFVSAYLVLRWAIGFVSRFGLAPFGWYRIALGSLGFAFLLG